MDFVNLMLLEKKKCLKEIFRAERCIEDLHLIMEKYLIQISNDVSLKRIENNQAQYLI